MPDLEGRSAPDAYGVDGGQLCACNFWTGRTALHRRREGCTESPAVRSQAGSVNEAVGKMMRSYVIAMTPVMESLGEAARTLGASWRQAAIQAERERRASGPEA